MRLSLGVCLFVPAAFGQSLFGFLPNSGQFPPAVRYVRYSQYTGYSYLTHDTFVLSSGERVQVLGMDENAPMTPVSPLPATYNVYVGSDPAKWIVNAREYAGVSVANVYPGIGVTFTTESGASDVVFSLAPGVDPSAIHLRVTPPSSGLSVITKVGPNGGTAQVPSRLEVDGNGNVSVVVAGADPSLALTVAVRFLATDLTSTLVQASGFSASYLQYPTNFGQDGSVATPNCGLSACNETIITDSNGGAPVWVTVFGGSGNQTPALTPAGSRVAVALTTSASDFPVTPGAPYPSPGSDQGAYLIALDGMTGALVNATYAGLPGKATGPRLAAGPSGDVALGATVGQAGYLERWQPEANRILFQAKVNGPVQSVAPDNSGDVYFTDAGAPGTVTAGAVNAAGSSLFNPVTIAAAATDSLIQPDASGFWVAYTVTGDSGITPVWVTRISQADEQVRLTQVVASTGTLGSIGLTQDGNLTLLVGLPSATESTTADAPLVSGCAGSSYFATVTPAGELAFATYTAPSGIAAGSPSIACVQSTAGRVPEQGIASGELITIVGGGFGPASATYTAPDVNGMYPLSAEGLSVKINGMDAPVIAVARGLIAVQVPSGVIGNARIEVSLNGAPLNGIGAFGYYTNFHLFDTGDRNNALNLPQLAALNQDGTVNSASNPARAGTIVSLFGSGAGPLQPPLPVGGVNPVPPLGPLSTSTLLPYCFQCDRPFDDTLYFGSAPGLSTGVVQLNVRLPMFVMNGPVPVPLNEAVLLDRHDIPVRGNTGVVFVQ